MSELAAKEIRYIKLGAGGRWERVCLERGELQFGYAAVPHELCLVGEWDSIVQLLTQAGQSLTVARDSVREIRDFYMLGPDCLRVTIAEGHLWWSFAEPEVHWMGEGEGHGTRMRRTIGGWRNADLKGEPLRTDRLSTRLTLVAAYRKTICRISDSAYLLRRLKGEEEPIITRAQATRSEMIATAEEMIRGLHWADFETLVDLIFSRSGWQRISRTGGTQKDIDLVIQCLATGERAFVQVKSRASAAVLANYVERFERAGEYDRLFFVCHSETDRLGSNGRDHLHVWTGAAWPNSASAPGYSTG